jgi:aryl carrier-like protein
MRNHLTRIRKKLTKLGLRVFLWLIVPLICAEVFLTLVDWPKGLPEYDPDLGFRCRAYYPTVDGSLTNAFGFNDQDHPLQKSPGTFRVLVVGDSFGWAGGGEGNYIALLRRKFERYYGDHLIEVLNSGYPGTSTGEQLAMLKKYGLQYNPDLVILGFYVGNDFIEADPYRKRIAFNGVQADIDKRHEHRILGYPIILPSRSFWILLQRYLTFTDSWRARREQQSLGQPQTLLSERSYLRVEGRQLDFFNLNSFREGRYKPNINYIFQSISEMDSLLSSRNIRFIVAIFPDEFQVNRKLFETLLAKFKLSQEDYDLNLGQNLLRSFLDSKGIRYVDLTDRFRAEGEKRDLYLLRDTHWNSAGIKLAADILFEELVKEPGPAGLGAFSQPLAAPTAATPLQSLPDR